MSEPFSRSILPSQLPSEDENPPQQRQRHHQYNAIPDYLRERIVQAVVDGATRAEVARRFGFHWSTINNIVTTFENTGRIHRQARGGRRDRHVRIEERHIGGITDFLREHPGATLQEIKEDAVQRFPELAQVHTSTISKALHDRAHITLKRMTIEHAKHNSDETKTRQQEFIAGLQAQQRLLSDGLFFDEAGFNLHISRRLGRSPRGQRAKQPKVPANQGQNLSLVVAVDRTGVVRHETVLGAFNMERFVRFLREDVLTAPGVCRRSRMFIMDNVPFHRSEEVKATIEGAGHVYSLLPPYSPWLNLAEYVFSKIKPLVSRKELRDRNGLINVIDATIAEVTAANCQGWLREVGRYAEAAALGHPLGREHDACDTLRIRAND